MAERLLQLVIGVFALALGSASLAQAPSLRDVLDRAEPVPPATPPSAESAALQRHLAGCWTIPGDVPRDVSYPVAVMFEINRAGFLTQPPQALNAEPIDADPLWSLVEASALAAVTACQPYEFLVEPEALSKIVIMEFDSMIAGESEGDPAP